MVSGRAAILAALRVTPLGDGHAGQSTVTDREVLTKMLAGVSESGLAYDLQEHSADSCAVAIAFIDVVRSIGGAVSVASTLGGASGATGLSAFLVCVITRRCSASSRSAAVCDSFNTSPSDNSRARGRNEVARGRARSL